MNQAPLPHFTFPDNKTPILVYGADNENLRYLEKLLSIRIAVRGNHVHLDGEHSATQQAQRMLHRLCEMSQQQPAITCDDIDQIHHNINFDSDTAVKITITGKIIAPKSQNQQTYLKALQSHDLVFGLGPAGTGKTFLAVAHGLYLLQEALVRRIILTRPAVEAGEHLGFLPGDMYDKIDPYLRPIHDALADLLKAADLDAKRQTGVIEIAPLAYMRGRTLKDAFILVDEAQNTTRQQMQMVLTRLGGNSRMVVTGDLSQVDLNTPEESGLHDAVERLAGIDDIAIHHFLAQDIMRHRLVQKIVQAYQQ
ncbi:MAG: PhoH family protein [Pseudomonadota bacterium]